MTSSDRSQPWRARLATWKAYAFLALLCLALIPVFALSSELREQRGVVIAIMAPGSVLMAGYAIVAWRYQRQ